MDLGKIKSCKEKVMQDFIQIDILINAAGENQKEATTF